MRLDYCEHFSDSWIPTRLYEAVPAEADTMSGFCASSLLSRSQDSAVDLLPVTVLPTCAFAALE